MKTLLVLLNKYAALDDDGDPAAYVLRVDLRSQSAKPILLGATRVIRAGKLKVDFTDEPVSVPDLGTYRRMIKTGELLAADEATAAAARVPWVPLSEQIELHRQRAIATFQAHHGQPPAWAAAAPVSDPATP